MGWEGQGTDTAGSDEAVAALTAAIDRVVAAHSETAPDAAGILALHRQARRLQAVVSAGTAAFEASGEWAAGGARTMTAWLTHQCPMPGGEARRLARLGRSMSALPVATAAWFEGAIGTAHMAALASLRRPETAEQLTRDEPVLVEQAATLPWAGFEQAVAYWEQLADPDGCDLAEEQRRNRRDASLVRSFDGMWLGRINLDPISGAVVAGELQRLEQQLYEADVADARDRLGIDEPRSGNLSRTPAQRRADALVEMATRSRTVTDDGRRPVPLFSVLVGYETMHGRVCELANGQVVAPGALLPWLTDAYVERAVFAPPARVEVSAASRFFTGATRRAVELRDRRCTHPMCDQPVEHCQVDHIVPWAEGGATTQDNGRLLCGYHNRLRNRVDGTGDLPDDPPPYGRPPPDTGPGGERPPPVGG